MVEIKRTDEHGNPIAAVDITLDQLEFIWHALRSVDDDFRSPELESTISQLF
jgi:DNA-binding cell septation regulator SpoVG